MREPGYRNRWPVSLILVAINVTVFVIEALLLKETTVRTWFALSHGGLAHGYLWQLITFQFLHGSLLHLALNCLMLYMFGRVVEELIGRNQFLVMYLAGGAFGGLLQIGLGLALPSFVGMGPVVGASAGVFTIIAAFALMHWEEPMTLLLFFILPVTIKAKYLVIAEVVLALLGIVSRDPGIAHGAHLGGILAGLGFVHFVVRGNLPAWPAWNWRRIKPAPRKRELVTHSSAKTVVWQPPADVPAEDLSSPDFMSKEVDPILDKISAHGIQSLTPRERKILEAARSRINKR
jgi:membrane associated rhomboid family serine protease